MNEETPGDAELIRLLHALPLTPGERDWATYLAGVLVNTAKDIARKLPADVRAFAIVAAFAQATDVLENQIGGKFGELMAPGPMRFSSDDATAE